MEINKYLDIKKLTFRNVLIAALFLIVLLSLSFSPYFNLFFTPKTIIIPFYLVCVILFGITGKTNIALGIVSLILATPWLLVGNRISVESLGIFSFFAVLVGSIQQALSLRKEI